MRWWETSVGGPTRGRIIALLRRGELSVEDLADALEVTDNAVRAQLEILEREGIVRQARVRRAGVVGKPPTLYEVTPEAEPLLSNAYAPMLRALLEALESRLTPKALTALLREAGARLAATAESAAGDEGRADPGGDLETRVRAAAALLAALGAEVDVEREGAGFLIRGYACPLSDAVRAQPKTCRAVEALVSDVVGVPVQECCERGAVMRCRFSVAGAKGGRATNGE